MYYITSGCGYGDGGYDEDATRAVQEHERGWCDSQHCPGLSDQSAAVAHVACRGVSNELGLREEPLREFVIPKADAQAPGEVRAEARFLGLLLRTAESQRTPVKPAFASPERMAASICDVKSSSSRMLREERAVEIRSTSFRTASTVASMSASGRGGMRGPTSSGGC